MPKAGDLRVKYHGPQGGWIGQIYREHLDGLARRGYWISFGRAYPTEEQAKHYIRGYAARREENDAVDIKCLTEDQQDTFEVKPDGTVHKALPDGTGWRISDKEELLTTYRPLGDYY